MLTDYVESREYIDRDELIKRFGDRYTVPDYETLSERYIAGRISQTLSAARDEQNRRLILAARGKDGIRYVFITACKNVHILKTIKERIARDIDGQTASLQKVDLQLQTVDGNSEDG